MTDIKKTDNQWKVQLTKGQYRILRQKGTEAPFTGKYVYENGEGTYKCAGCGVNLFESGTKFDANCGWPSFYDAKPGSVIFKEDTSHGMVRTEVQCAACGGHLGHLFEDAPDQPTGQRYCINSAALDFSSEKKA